MAGPEQPTSKLNPFDDTTSLAAAVCMGTLAAIAIWLIAATQLAYLIGRFTWHPLNQTVIELVRAAPQLPRHLSDPQAAFGADADFPNRFVWWGCLLLVLVGIAWIAWSIRGWIKQRQRGNKREGTTKWASKRELKDIARAGRTKKARGKFNRRMLLAETRDFRAATLRLEADNHALVVAGTRSGKTAGLCTPAILNAEGCVVIAASVKDDLVKDTIRARERQGSVFVFDPTNFTTYPCSGWSPVSSSRTWREAQSTAAAFIEVTLGAKGGDQGNMQFFASMTKQVLPCMFHAAALDGLSIRDVVRWTQTLSTDATLKEVEDILVRFEAADALDPWRGFAARDEKLRDNIAATVQSTVTAYTDEKVQLNARTSDITPERLFDGGANTLYVVAPPNEQKQLEPVFVALLQSLLGWLGGQPEQSVPVIVVIDEAANVAPMPELPTYLSTIGSRHVQILTAWQDFSQIKSRYSDGMYTILNNSRAKLILPGVSDPETIKYFSDVTGETVDTIRRDKDLGEGQSRSILTPATIREQDFGEALLVYGNLPPAKVNLRLFFRDPIFLLLSTRGVAPASGFVRKVALTLPRFLGIPLARSFTRTPPPMTSGGLVHPRYDVPADEPDVVDPSPTNATTSDVIAPVTEAPAAPTAAVAPAGPAPTDSAASNYQWQSPVKDEDDDDEDWDDWDEWDDDDEELWGPSGDGNSSGRAEESAWSVIVGAQAERQSTTQAPDARLTAARRVAALRQQASSEDADGKFDPFDAAAPA